MSTRIGFFNKQTRCGSYDPVTTEIRLWLRENVASLVDKARQVGENLLCGELKIITVRFRANEGDLARSVMRNRSVADFPCFRNVELAALDFLRSLLESLTHTEAVLFNVDSETYKIRRLAVVQNRFVSPVEMKFGTAGHEMGFVANTVIESYIPGAGQSLEDPVSYWKIVRSASSYERDECKFERDVKTARWRWRQKKTTNAQRIGSFGKAILGVEPRLKGVKDELNESVSNLEGENEFSAPLENLIPHIIPISSLSARVRSSSAFSSPYETYKSQLGNGTVVPVINQRADRFWNSRYLFNLVETPMHTFEGAALDTITGEIHNADLYKIYNKDLWHLKLSRATIPRWYVYVRTSQAQEFDRSNFRPIGRNLWVLYSDCTPGIGTV